MLTVWTRRAIDSKYVSGIKHFVETWEPYCQGLTDRGGAERIALKLLLEIATWHGKCPVAILPDSEPAPELELIRI